MKRQTAYHTPSQARSAYEEEATPRLVGHYAGLHPEDRPTLTQERLPPQRTSQSRVQYQFDDDGESEEDVYTTRLPTSARRYQVPAKQGPRTVVRVHQQQPIPPRRSRMEDYSLPTERQTQRPRIRMTEPPVTQPVKGRRELHWLFPMGLALLAFVLLSIVGSFVWHRVAGALDDLHYGRPRTFQCDARVGHNDARTPSHFLALNLHRHIEVIELPGGDASQAKVYQGPTVLGEGQDLTPVTLEFKDVNGDGKPDMIVEAGPLRVVFINENGAFRPVRPSDTVNL